MRLAGRGPCVIRLSDERVCCRLGPVAERAGGVIDRLFGRGAWVMRLPDERVCCRLRVVVERTDGATDRMDALDETDGRNEGRAPNEDMRGAPPK